MTWAGATITARAIRWRRDPANAGQWIDDQYGFAVWLDKSYQLPAIASWDDGCAAWMMRDMKDQEKRFDTMIEAKAWCQEQADEWIVSHAIVAPARRGTARQAGRPRTKA